VDAKQIKDYLLDDSDRIVKLLEDCGFHDLTIQSNEIRCAAPERENGSAVRVKLVEGLPATDFGDVSPYRGDILGLVQRTLNLEFVPALRYIAELFGLVVGRKKTNRVDLLAPLKALYKGANTLEIKENELHNKSILNEYVAIAHEYMLREGVSPSVLRQFDVRFDVAQSRIIFPHYDWKQTDKVVGITGRTTFDSDLIKLLDIPKYWNYIKGYSKMNNLYGWKQIADQNRELDKLIIFEAEKSVQKEFTLNRGQGSSVSIGGHELSEQQIKFILGHTGSDCEIIFAYDKDVTTTENLHPTEFLEGQVKRFSGLRNVSFIYDKNNILGPKDSPVDKGFKVWNFLLKYRTKLN
jgi:DNA primase